MDETKRIETLEQALRVIANMAEYTRTGCDYSSEFMAGLEDIVNVAEDALSPKVIATGKVYTIDRPIDSRDDHPSLTAGARNA